MTLPVALQVYSVREDMNRDFEGTLKKIKAMGYDGVEFAGLYGRDPADVRRMLDEIGLTGISAHIPLKELIQEGTLENYRTIGCRYVALPWLGEEDRPGGPRFEELLAHLRAVGAKARALGMTLLYHNHDFEFAKLGDTCGLDILYSRIPADTLQTELDTCWVSVAGQDPLAYLNKYTDRAPLVHLKDFVLAGSKPKKLYDLIGTENEADDEEPAGTFEFRPLGCGLLDVPAVIAASERAGAQWLVVEQDSPSMGKTPLECVEISMRYLKTL